MKKMLTLLLLLPAIAFCNELEVSDQPVYQDTKIVCASSSVLFEALKKYGEIPMLSLISYRTLATNQDGNASQLDSRLFANPSTGTWTLVERHDGDLYCVIGIGEQLKPIQRTK
jgi:hypothetical protein